MAGSSDYVEKTTAMFSKEMKVSKIQDTKFRFCGVDLELKEGKIFMSMNEYAKTIEEIPIRKGKRKEFCKRIELLAVKKVCGQVIWLANTNRPDLAYNAMKLAMYTKETKLEDLKFVNDTVRKVRERESIMIFEKIGKLEDLIVYGFSDASFKFGEKAVGGLYVMLGEKNSDRVLSLNWKSKLMKSLQECKRSRDSQFRNSAGLCETCSKSTVTNIVQQQRYYKKNGCTSIYR